MTFGKFIVLEGIDGSGKTTQVKHLTEWFSSIGYGQKQHGVNLKEKRLVVTQEPRNTLIGNILSFYLESVHPPKASPRLELWLFNASRVAHLEEIIIPVLNQGHLVLCDRFTDSTIAYQHYGKGVKKSIVNQLNYFATDGLTSDLTIVIDVDVKTALSRTKLRGNQDNFEKESHDFFARVRQGYLDIVEKNPLTHVLIDGNLPEEKVTEQIIKAIKNKLEL